MYGYKCEYCDGIVQEKLLKQEVFKHKRGFVILEDVLIGVCDQCGNRYYSSEILKTVDAIATGKKPPEKMQTVPVAHAS
jgi:YgiT-type zinc finger domain-containing protein